MASEYSYLGVLYKFSAFSASSLPHNSTTFVFPKVVPSGVMAPIFFAMADDELLLLSVGL
jgi:hypothetical protein